MISSIHTIMAENAVPGATVVLVMMMLVVLCGGMIAGEPTRQLPLDSTQNLTLVGVKADVTAFKGRTALHLVEDPAAKRLILATVLQIPDESRHKEGQGDGQSITDADEARLGAALATQFDQRRGIATTMESQQIQSYLQTVADRVAAHASRKLAYKIHYDPHPGFRSAFALPGGHIIVGGGVLALMRTEDELAAVLGHEIIHIDEGQVSQRIKELAKTQHLSVADVTKWDVGDFGVTYSHEQELACDRGGAKLAVQAGYSPLPILRLLQVYKSRFEETPNVDASRRNFIDERIRKMEETIRSQGWSGLTNQKPLALP